MNDDTHNDEDRALYAAWRRALSPAPEVPAAMMLAAYAENRLDEAAAAEVEWALVADSSLIDDILAARHPDPVLQVTPEIFRRAEAAHRLAQGAEVIRFVPRTRATLTGMRGVIAWGAVAATVVLVSCMGFDLGIEVQRAIEGTANATPVDIFADPSAG
jgi:hypothetical protein